MLGLLSGMLMCGGGIMLAAACVRIAVMDWRRGNCADALGAFIAGAGSACIALLGVLIVAGALPGAPAGA